MPPLKEPLTAKEMAIAQISKILERMCMACVRKLPKAAEAGHQAYLEQIQKMQRESELYSELLLSLPTEISEDIRVKVVSYVIDTVDMFDGIYKALPAAATYDKEQYNTACRNIVRSVLCPSIRRY
jgi:hypothetical protein